MSKKKNQDIIDCFKSGKIVIFPTDTAFGIGCRMDFDNSVKKVFQIRKRIETKPLLVLASSFEMVERYAFVSDEVRSFIDSYWPGGITLILPCRKENVPGVVRANGDTLAIRIPKHNELLKVIDEVGVPIVAPSANISGHKTPYSFEEVEDELAKNADCVFNDECTYKKESTIIDTTHTPWSIIRQGAVKIDNL